MKRGLLVVVFIFLLVNSLPVLAFSPFKHSSTRGANLTPLQPENVTLPQNTECIASGVMNGNQVYFITSLPCMITETGYYILNVSANVSGTAISINADNVVLDGNGNTIQGDGNEYGIYSSNHANITIKNLKIENFQTEVYLYSSHNVTIDHNNLTNNNWYGVHLYYS